MSKELMMYQQMIRRKLELHWTAQELQQETTLNKSYWPGLERLFNRLPCYFEDLTTEDLIAHVASLESKNERELQKTIIKAVYRYALDIYLPGSLLPAKRPKRKLQPWFTPEEVQKLIEATPNKGHRLIIATGYAAGLRVSETVFLKKKDLYHTGGCLFIDGEGKQIDRLVPVPTWLLDELKAFCELKKETDFIWPGQYSGYITTGTVQKIIKAAREKAGIQHGASTHGLRRGYGTKMAQSTDLVHVKNLLGHASVKTTEMYIYPDMESLGQIPNPAAGLKVA